jgi:hypothetical protein
MKTYELRATSDPTLFRVVDRQGEWEHYARFVDSGNLDPRTATYLRGVTAILHRAWGKPQLMTWAKNQLPGIVEQKLHYGGEKGDAVHQFVAKVLSGFQSSRETLVVSEDKKTERALTNAEWDCILAAASFWNRHACKLIAHELSVANLKFGYAGSLDVIFRLMKACGVKACSCAPFVGRLILGDWKSGGGIWPDMGAQIAAYAKSDLSQILHGHKLGGTAIIRLGTKHKTTGGYEVKFFNVEKTRVNWSRFQAAIRIDDAEYKPFDPSVIFDIPDSVEFTVEREELEPKNLVEAVSV